MLWCCILICVAHCIGIGIGITIAEVCQFDFMADASDEDVFRFQVQMDNLVLMQIADDIE